MNDEKTDTVEIQLLMLAAMAKDQGIDTSGDFLANLLISAMVDAVGTRAEEEPSERE